MRFFRQSRGQVLVEAIVALSVLSMGFLGIFNLLNESIGASRTVNENYVATYLAAEGIELTKYIWDTDWQRGGAAFELAEGSYELQFNVKAFSDDPCPAFQETLPYPANLTECTRLHLPGDFLKFDATTGLYNYGVGTLTTFKRTIQITKSPNDPVNNPSSDDHIRVRSIVTWTARGGGTSQVQLEDHFFAPPQS